METAVEQVYISLHIPPYIRISIYSFMPGGGGGDVRNKFYLLQLNPQID